MWLLWKSGKTLFAADGDAMRKWYNTWFPTFPSLQASLKTASAKRSLATPFPRWRHITRNRFAKILSSGSSSFDSIKVWKQDLANSNACLLFFSFPVVYAHAYKKERRKNWLEINWCTKAKFKWWVLLIPLTIVEYVITVGAESRSPASFALFIRCRISLQYLTFSDSELLAMACMHEL